MITKLSLKDGSIIYFDNHLGLIESLQTEELKSVVAWEDSIFLRNLRNDIRFKLQKIVIGEKPLIQISKDYTPTPNIRYYFVLNP